MSNIIVGLDIGTTKIACFIGQQDENGKLKILGHGKTESIGVERGVVKNVLDTSKSIRKAVEIASNQANVDVDEVYVGIAGQHIKSIQSQGSIMIPADHRLITEEDVQHLIDDQHRVMLQPGEEIIHIFPQTYSVDNEELEVSPVGVAGKCLRATFHIITGNTENLRNIQYSVEDAGLRIKDVVLEPIASSYAVLTKVDKDAGVVLVDIGGGTTDIAIFQDGIIRHTSVLPLAGNAITEDIRKGCGILKGQAESLKTKFGSCLPSNVRKDDIIAIPGISNQPKREISMQTLAGIVKARLQVILEQVAYEITLSGYDKQLLAGIVLTGGGARTQHIKELCDLITKTNSRIGEPVEHLNERNEELAHPMYSTGIGLVLYGIEEENRVEELARRVKEENNSNDPFSKFDIFSNMDTHAPEAQSSQAPEATEEPDPKEKKKRKKSVDNDPNNDSDVKKEGTFLSEVKKYFGRTFFEDIDED